MDDPTVVDAETSESTQEPAEAAPLALRMTADTLADIKRQAVMFDEIRRVLVSLTSPAQWVRYFAKDGKELPPYLEGDGALTIAAALGAQIAPPRYEWIELPGGALQCLCHQQIAIGDRTFEDHGDCDEFDHFLIRRKRELEEQGVTREQVRILVRTEIMKKARANAQSRIVTGLSGLRGLAWSDLERLGLSQQRVADEGGTVRHKGRGASGAAPKGQGGASRSQSASKKPDVPDECPLKTAAEALELPKGEWFSLRGEVQSVSQWRLAGNGRHYADVSLRDETGMLVVRLWTNDDYAWLGVGAAVSAPQVKVGEYRDKRQYNTEKITPLESNHDGSPAGGGDNPGDNIPF